MKNKDIKYWTACIKNNVLVTTGNPATSLRVAKRMKRSLNSQHACVVRADKAEMPTTEIVA